MVNVKTGLVSTKDLDVKKLPSTEKKKPKPKAPKKPY